MNIRGILNKGGPAPLWKRTFAYVIDVLIVDLVIVLPFQPLLNKISGKGENFAEMYAFFNNNPANIKIIFFVSLLISLFTVLYWAILEYKLKQSVGKMIMKIYVRSKTKNLTFYQCFVRNISKMSLLPLVVDCSYMFFKKTNQRYLEKITNTEVIDKRVVSLR